jgi:hypothetical protein
MSTPAPVPVQNVPAPMQPSGMAPVSVPMPAMPSYAPSAQSFQQAYGVFNGLANDLHNGVIVPQNQSGGRYSVGGVIYGGGADTPVMLPDPGPVYGPPTPNTTPYNGGQDMGPQTASPGPYADTQQSPDASQFFQGGNNSPVPMSAQPGANGYYGVPGSVDSPVTPFTNTWAPQGGPAPAGYVPGDVSPQSAQAGIWTGGSSDGGGD